MEKLGSFLILLLAIVVVGVRGQCENFTPAFPAVVSPVLSSVIPILSPDYTIFTWTRPDLGVCDGVVDEIYQVMIAGKDSTLDINGIPLCEVEKTTSCFITDFSQLVDGDEYKWSVKLILNSTHNRAILELETAGYFAWCEPAAPIEPTLSGPLNNETFEYQEDIVLSWTTLSPQDFGKSCNGTANVINIYISRSNTSLDGLIFSRPPTSPSFTYDTLLFNPLDPGTWYWSIEASNSLSGTTSLVYYFNILPPDPIPCVPDCVVGQGSCNTTRGVCICEDGFRGDACAEAITTPTDAPTEPPSNPIPLIVGLVVAGVAVAIIIGFLVFFYLREKKKKEQFEMTTILIEPPDFTTLAFQPYAINPSPFGDYVAKKSSWSKFEQLLISEDYGLAISILSTSKLVNLENLCTWLVIVFENNKAGSNLVQTLMLRELEDFEGQKDNNSNLESNPMPYRGDSAATKAFKVYTRIVGLPYLFETLGQILNDFCALLDEAEKNKEQESEVNKDASIPAGQSSASLRPAFNQMSMEVDPKRMNSEDDETINRLSLQLICQKLFVKIFRSVEIFPAQIRIICKKVRDESKKKESLQNVNLNVLLSNLIFLRFINPAILVPHQCGIVKDEPTKGTQRQLVLITKVLQNLAANVEFGKKEAFMTKLNDFIRANFGQMNNFLSSITENIDNNPTGVANYSTPIPVTILNSSLAGLYEYVYNNHELILASVQRVVSTRKAAHIEETLQEILREVGDPAAHSKK